MQVTVQPGKPIPPTPQELAETLARYRRRIPAQQQRLADAVAAQQAATAALDAARAEREAAEQAMQTLAGYITDLAKKVEG